MIVDLSEGEFVSHQENYDGICLSCNDWTTGGVEPDARNYLCPTCGQTQVFGADEALIMGHIQFTEDEDEEELDESEDEDDSEN